MKKYLFTLILAFAAVAAQAVTIEPSKTYVTRTLKIGSFTALRTNTAIDIDYTVGPQSVKLYVPDNLADYVKVTLSNNELVVSYRENINVKGFHKSRLIVSAPAVERFTTASAGNIKINSDIVLKEQNVYLNVLSVGDIKAQDITAGVIRLTTSSAGDINVGDLSATFIKFFANSAGDIDANNVIGADIHINANSAGDIEIDKVVASRTVSITANSAGDVEIDELSAENVTLRSNNAGDIKVDELEATTVDATVNSAGGITISGIAESANYGSGGSGNLKAGNLKAITIKAETIGTGDITCYPLQSLEAVCQGIGKIYYTHKPNRIRITGKYSDNGVKKA